MTRALRRRGEPFAVLALIVVGWIGARVAFASAGLSGDPASPSTTAAVETGVDAPSRSIVSSPFAVLPTRALRGEPARPHEKLFYQAKQRRRIALVAGSSLSPPKPPPMALAERATDSPRDAGLQTAPSFAASATGTRPNPERRWSADAWVLVRKSGGAGLGPGLAPGTYGASQAGAVLRYRLAPGNGHRPAAYLRVSRSLDRPIQTEAAAGLSARPFAGLPVIAAGELRLFRDRFGSRLRPVAMAVTEFPPVALPQALRAEVYLQGGYAWGRGATAFTDGQLRLDRAAMRVGAAELRLGAGAWGGAQKGAARADVGPSLAATAPLGGGTFARASLDWRFRVAGDAAPGSGPAFTLSAGF